MAIDIFNTRAMLAALEERKTAGTFLLDLLFSRVETSDSEYVDIDIVKGKRRIAPFVSPLKEGKVVENEGFKTSSYKPPYVKPKKITTAQSVLKRSAGETIYGNKTPQQRAAEKLAKDLAELDDMITRREEWMAAELLQNGSVTCTGDGISQVIDFGLDATHKVTLSGTDLWSDSASNPLKNIADWARLIRKDSGVNPNVAIMGSDVADALIANTSVQKLLDLRRIDLGLIDPTALPNGVTYYGSLKAYGTVVDLYSYDEWYVNDSGTETAMIGADKFILTSTNADFRRNYGAIEDLGALAALPRFPKTWEQDDPSARFVMVQSAPLVALHQVDALVSATVV